MKIKFTPIKKVLTFLALFTLSLTVVGKTQVSTLEENFDDFPLTGWTIVNNSNPVGPSAWHRGEPNETFVAHSGNDSSYAAADYTSTTEAGNINTWLITPVLNLQNGAILKFWTRVIADQNPEYADRLQVRLSTNGESVNVGTTASDVGDFETLLAEVNPELQLGVYPQEWTEFTASLEGITVGATGRIAFRYFVPNGGPDGDNSNYIGLDDVSYTTTSLPVTFISFNGVIKNDHALLNWSTANETNNTGFEVQRSFDGRSFSNVGFVAGMQNSSRENIYNFTDVKIVSGSNYYRLKQIDKDGRFKYSSTIKLDYSKFDWVIAGNPSANNSWIQLQLDKEAKVLVQIVSLKGQVVEIINKGILTKGTYSIPLLLSNSAPGIYAIKLVVDKETCTKKIIK